jgi:DNA-binding response OmpR family regulator
VDVFLADDDGMRRERTMRSLRARGYDVAGAASADELLFDLAHAFLRGKPAPSRALVVTRAALPGQGLHPVRVLREHGWAPPFIAIVDPDDRVARAEALALGAVAVLTDPVDTPTLCARVDRALTGPATVTPLAPREAQVAAAVLGAGRSRMPARARR